MNHQYIPTIYSTPIDKLDGTNWRNKIYMSLGRFGEAGEELRAEQRTTKYDVEEIRTDTIQYNTIVLEMMVISGNIGDHGVNKMNKSFNGVMRNFTRN
jgi:hypothetical protein